MQARAAHTYMRLVRRTHVGQEGHADDAEADAVEDEPVVRVPWHERAVVGGAARAVARRRDVGVGDEDEVGRPHPEEEEVVDECKHRLREVAEAVRRSARRDPKELEHGLRGRDGGTGVMDWGTSPSTGPCFRNGLRGVFPAGKGLGSVKAVLSRVGSGAGGRWAPASRGPGRVELEPHDGVDEDDDKHDDLRRRRPPRGHCAPSGRP